MLNTYLSRDAAKRLRQGTPWLAREDIVRVEGTPVAGEPVQLRDEDGVALGLADLDLEARQAVRRIGLPAEAGAEGLVPRHLRLALERRARFVDDPRFCRVVNDDGDGLPGLVVDRYDAHYVVQTLTRGMDARQAEIARALQEVTGATSVLLRNDGPRRRAAGLPAARPHVLAGAPPRWCRMLELGARFTVDLTYGPGPVYRYELREARRFLRRLANGARVLDVACGVGSLFVHAGLHGARSMLAFDANADSVELARENAEANGLGGRVKVQKADALAALKAAGGPFDLVLLDTPDAATADEFAERLRLALRATRIGGHLVAFGYQPALAPGALGTVVARACEDTGRVARQLARINAPADHPLLIGAPAGTFLGGLALEVA